MAASSPNTPEYLTVVCPICDSRLHFRPQQAGRTKKCPDCHGPIRLPEWDAYVAHVHQESRTEEKEKAGTYALKTVTKENQGTVRPQPAELPKYLSLLCPSCDTRIHEPVDQAGKKITCPDCFAEVTLPSREVIIRRYKKQRRLRNREASAAGEDHLYDLKSSTKPARVMTPYLDAQAEVHTEPPPPIPRWTFFSGVFSFPWQSGTLARLIYLTIGFVACGIVGAVAVSVFHSISPVFMGVLAFFVLPLIWLMLWTLSYAAACCLTIVQDTAAGNDRIVQWPEPIWKEWVMQLIYVVYMAGLAVSTGYLVGRLTGAVGPGEWKWLPMTIAVFFLFPFILLSSMAAQSPWTPVAMPIMRSLRSLWWGWLAYYGLTGLLFGLLGGLAWLVASGSPAAAVMVVAFFAASILFIAARLLGRLAWRISLTDVFDDDEQAVDIEDEAGSQ